MKCKAETMEDVEKDCMPFLDGIEMATNLELDHAKDMLLGKITLPLKPKEPANHALVLWCWGGKVCGVCSPSS